MFDLDDENDSHDDHKVKIYRTLHEDSGRTEARGFPSCSSVNGWYLSIGGLPFWKVSTEHRGHLEGVAAMCEFTFLDWPEGKNIRDEVPHKSSNMMVVLSKSKPPNHPVLWKTGWKGEL